MNIKFKQVGIAIILFIASWSILSCKNKALINETIISTNATETEDNKEKIVEESEVSEKPDYLYYVTLNGNDLYMDTKSNIFIFENGERKLVLRTGKHPYGNTLFGLQEMDISSVYIDKEENLYMFKGDIGNQKMYVIDKDLNVNLLTEHCLSFAIVDNTMFYTDRTPSGVHKYENGENEIIFKHGNKLLRINKVDDKSFILTKTKIVNGPVDYEALSVKEENIIIPDDKWQKLLYKNGEFTIYNGEINEDNPTRINNKKLDSSEKIKNYIKSDYENTFESLKTQALVENNEEYKEADNYLFFDDDGSVSYYLKGKQICETLVFVEGTINTNKGRICFDDTYAYYFGNNGKAMKHGKITFADKERFETDENYRILKSCKHVYDLAIKSDNFELYNNYCIYGKCEQDGINDNDKEDIKWIVLEDNGSEVLLLSKYILDYKEYDQAYLNGEFYNNSFSEDEKQRIISKNNNKIFLIDESKLNSCKEAYKNKYNSNLLSAIPTNSTVNKGIETSKDDNDYYGHASYLIANNKIVKADGTIEILENMNLKIGYRPAMWVRKD